MDKAKLIFSPGLINLILIECLFLILVIYIGLCLWTGMSVTVIDGVAKFVAGLLLLSVFSRRTGS